ncbi:MAG: metal ABC transporter permease [Defluviitaleaceae bacterium]|nr:metal ABC transporter permease [Defluviitaleaceae bacterium]
MLNNFLHIITNYGFMGRAVLAAVLVGVVAGAIGTFIILRGLSLMGDAISHAVIPGVAISQLLGISHFIGATTFGILASFAIGFVSEKSKLKKDAIIGIVFSSFFALGLVLISRIRSVTDLHSVLFGNVLTVSTTDIRAIIFVGVVLVIFIALFYKELLITSFDETLAKVYGLKTRVIHYSFLFVLTLIIVTSLQVVGAIMIVAMIIAPAATSYLLTNRLPVMLALSTSIGAISAIVGMFFSLSFNLPSGASIVLTLASIFVLTLIFAPKKGLVYQIKSNSNIKY